MFLLELKNNLIGKTVLYDTNSTGKIIDVKINKLKPKWWDKENELNEEIELHFENGDTKIYSSYFDIEIC